jgi:hypothetical protein
MLLLADEGLLTFVQRTSMRMTAQGHDLLDSIRSDTVWQKAKEGAAAVGGVTLGMLKELAVAYLKREVSDRLGISLP